jgi:hypothetical protein
MWNLLDPSFIAIAAEDTSVRIWEVKSESKPIGAPIRDFSHSPVTIYPQMLDPLA